MRARPAPDPARLPRYSDALDAEDDLRIDDLLDGQAPTEAWLATDDAARILSDAGRRTLLCRAVHPRPDPSYAPLLRSLLAHEVALRRDARAAAEDALENLYWCALLLAQLGDVRDVLALWRAKNTDLDSFCGFDVQLLVAGAGVEQTLAFLARSEDPAAAEAAEYVSRCADAGDSTTSRAARVSAELLRLTYGPRALPAAVVAGRRRW